MKEDKVDWRITLGGESHHLHEPGIVWRRLEDQNAGPGDDG